MVDSLYPFDQHPGINIPLSFVTSWLEVIECLLKNKAFVAKKKGENAPEDHPHELGQYTWSKYGGPHKAWKKVKEAVFWPRAT